MKLVLLIVACFICVVTSQRCCTPPQWTGVLNGADFDKEEFFFEFVYYDQLMGKGRFDVFANENRTEIITTTIERFDLGRVYTIFPGKNCTYFNISGDMPPACTPQNPSAIYKFTMGITLNAATYEYTHTKEFFKSVTVAEQGCIPIFGDFFSRRHGNMNGMQLAWFDITMGIKDPGIFDPPGNCTPEKN